MIGHCDVVTSLICLKKLISIRTRTISIHVLFLTATKKGFIEQKKKVQQSAMKDKKSKKQKKKKRKGNQNMT